MHYYFTDSKTNPYCLQKRERNENRERDLQTERETDYRKIGTHKEKKRERKKRYIVRKKTRRLRSIAPKQIGPLKASATWLLYWWVLSLPCAPMTYIIQLHIPVKHSIILLISSGHFFTYVWIHLGHLKFIFSWKNLMHGADYARRTDIKTCRHKLNRLYINSGFTEIYTRTLKNPTRLLDMVCSRK